MQSDRDDGNLRKQAEIPNESIRFGLLFGMNCIVHNSLVVASVRGAELS